MTSHFMADVSVKNKANAMKISAHNPSIYEYISLGCFIVLLSCGFSQKDALTTMPETTPFIASISTQGNSSDANQVVSADLKNGGMALQSRQEIVMDKGLNMPFCTITVPDGWTLVHDIVSNTYTDGFLKFILYLENPQGEIRGLMPPLFKYAVYQTPMSPQPSGVSFEQAIYDLVSHQLQPVVGSFSMGQTSLNAEAMENPELKPLFERTRQDVQSANQSYMMSGMQGNSQADLGVFQTEIEARRNNQPFKGLVTAIKVGRIESTPYMQSSSGFSFGVFFLAPSERFEQLKEEKEPLLTYQLNPDWDKQKSRIIDKDTQQMSRNHQANMNARQQQFNQHQQNMRETQQLYDQQNQAWYNRNFGPNGSSSYSGNQAFIDGAITGQTTFNDPYSGFQIRQDGHYDHWFTNEFGEYKGTNDPNFDPSSLPGNWTPIKPVTPDH